MRRRPLTVTRLWRSTNDRGRRRLRRVLLTAVVGASLLAGAAVTSVTWIRDGAEGHLFTERDVPEAPVALVLGTRVRPDGTPSPFLTARLEIARRLLADGRVRAILVSGDNLDPGYDEPGAMRRWLVDQGVPSAKVALDHAGLDTYDSCARAKRIFGVDRAIVVTQSFHLPRAVAVCRRLGVDVDGVGDETARAYARTWRISSTREYGACVKAALDLLSGRDPAHLGPRRGDVGEAVRG